MCILKRADIYMKINENQKVTLTLGQLRRLVKEMTEPLTEAGLSLGGKQYPNSGNVLIMAGGAGSGKGWILDNLLLFNGKKFDVDELKIQAKKLGKKKPNSEIAKKFEDRYGYPLGDLDLGNPQDVSQIHAFIEDLGWPKKLRDNFFNDLKNNAGLEKPNVIFDVTLKKTKKFIECCTTATDAGYDKKNIHLVWVVNVFDEALRNNRTRKRKVSNDILFQSHEGVALTMKDIVDGTKILQQYMDGDVWLVFAQKNIDTLMNKKYLDPDNQIEDPSVSNKYVVRYNAYQMKAAGEPCKSFNEIDDKVREKLIDYLPFKSKELFKKPPEEESPLA